VSEICKFSDLDLGIFHEMKKQQLNIFFLNSTQQEKSVLLMVWLEKGFLL